MKFLTSKSITKKLIIAIVLVLLVNFTLAPHQVQAGVLEEVGNVVLDIVILIGDGIMWLLQKLIYGGEEILIDTQEDQGWIGVLLGVLAAVLVIAISIATLGTALIALGVIAGVAVGYFVTKALPDNFQFPYIVLSPEEIFSNKVPLIDVNFFDPKEIKSVNVAGMEGFEGTLNTNVYYMDNDRDGSFNEGIDTIVPEHVNERGTTASQLADTVSRWYVSLRNVALVGLMTVLVYVGIRMAMSSVANEKAKYKSMMQDWVMAMILLFTLHYIMFFTVTIVERITNAIAGKSHMVVVVIPSDDLAEKVTNYAADQIRSVGMDPNVLVKDVDGTKYVFWPTNFIGAARIETQTIATRVVSSDEAGAVEETEQDEQRTLFQKAANTIIYIVLIMFTIFYLFFYIKRLIYLAFLTLIAPLITLTYPIDKLNDGQAQGFNVWIKEYVFNMLIQPFHLILYYILIGSAFEFAKENIVYTCVALGFMLPAENLLRRMFNFEKAQTAKAFSGAAGGALAMAGIQNLAKLAGIGKGGKGGGGGSGRNGSNGDDGSTPPRTRTLNPADVEGEDGPAPEEEPPPIDEREETPLEAMADVYNEGFGTDEWDPQVADAMQREIAAEHEETDKEKLERLQDGRETMQQMVDGSEDEDEKKLYREQVEAYDAEIKKLMGETPPGAPIGELKKAQEAGKLKKALYALKRPAIRGLVGANNKLPSFVRAVGGVMGGAALGVVGGAIGIATGSPQNVMKGIGIGVGTGSAAGQALGGASIAIPQAAITGVPKAIRRIGTEMKAGVIEAEQGKLVAARYEATVKKQESAQVTGYVDANYEGSRKELGAISGQLAQMSVDTGEDDMKRVDKARVIAEQLAADMRKGNEGKAPEQRTAEDIIQSRSKDMAEYALKEAKGITKQDLLDDQTKKNMAKKVENDAFKYYNNGQRSPDEARKLAKGWSKEVMGRVDKIVN